MSQHSYDLTDADVRLLQQLGRVAEAVDPVPDHVRAAGQAAFALRNFDAELMEAVEVDSAKLEPVRGTAPTSRMHFFEFGELSIDVEVTARDGFCAMVGMVADPNGTDGQSVTVETTSASFTTQPDTDGRFEVKQVPAGMMRLSLDRGDRPRVVTPWFDVP